MARKPSSRVVLARAGLDELRLAVADGLLEVGQTIVETADPPDATPYGEGLVTHGGVLVYADRKKVAGWSQRGTQPKKPRAARLGRGITLLVGWGFPGRFQEFGTVHHRAQPFATPAAQEVMAQAGAIMAPIVKSRGHR